MNILIFFLLLFTPVLWLGCTGHRNGLASREVVRYYDRNDDGKVDQERHHYPGAADLNWELRDDNYDGRYEKKILYGYTAIKSVVDLPVPNSENIEASLTSNPTQ